ncbi:MAG: glycosyltransferase family 2 protein [Fusobacteriota bacterium]
MVDLISKFVITYFILLNLSYLLLFFISYFGIKSYRDRLKLNNYLMLYQSKLTPPISLIVPAYNESDTIIKNIKSFLSDFNYPNYEIVVVNDGSKDDTLKKVLKEFNCGIDNFPYRKIIKTKKIKNIYKSVDYDNLLIVDKENGGKADALNAGINVSRYPYFGSIDADTILEPDSYLKVTVPILNQPKKVIASGGIVGVINGCETSGNKIKKINYPKNILAKFQVVEYLRAFLFGRYAWTTINALPIISGAFGLFKKEAVGKVGGYSSDETKVSTVGEDMDLIIRLHRYYRENNLDYKIIFVPDPLSWTQVPEDFKTLKNQRERWHRGLIETLFQSRDMLFNKKYGSIGILGLPYYLIFEMLSPIIEISGYILLPYFYFRGYLDFKVLGLFFIVSVLLGVIISSLAVFLEVMTFRRYKKSKDIFQMILISFLENFGYRQITLIFRLMGFIKFYKKDKTWGEMKRNEIK